MAEAAGSEQAAPARRATHRRQVSWHANSPVEEDSPASDAETVYEVRVTVVQARDLKNKDLFGKIDPYCTLRLGHVQHQTKRVKSTLNPTFADEHFLFRVREDVLPVGFVLLTLYSSNVITADEFLGEARLHLRELRNAAVAGSSDHNKHAEGYVDLWLPLRPLHPRDPVSGEVRVHMRLVRPEATLSLMAEGNDRAVPAASPSARRKSIDTVTFKRAWEFPTGSSTAAPAPATAVPALAAGPVGSLISSTGDLDMLTTRANNELDNTKDPAVITVSDLMVPGTMKLRHRPSYHNDCDASNVLSIIVISAKNLVPDERKKPIAPYVKLRVGCLDAARSQTISDVEGIVRQERGEGNMTDPEFRARFEFRISRGEHPVILEVRSRYILRTKLLASYTTTALALAPMANQTFERWLPLEVSPEIRHTLPLQQPQLRVLVTRHRAVDESEVVPFQNLKAAMPLSYAASLNRLLGDSNLGTLRITLYRGTQLQTGSGSPPNVFMQLELGQMCHRSQTKWENPNPIWDGEVFDFPITDLASTLDLTVFHEHGTYMVDQWVAETEFLGARRLSVAQLLSLDTKLVWVGLKDMRLAREAKGSVFLKAEISCSLWDGAMSLRNEPAEAICTCSGDVPLRPHRSGCTRQEFKLSRLKQNVERLSAVVDACTAFSNHIDDILDWKDPQYTFTIYIIYNIVVFFYRPWMWSLAGVVLLLYHYQHRDKVVICPLSSHDVPEEGADEIDLTSEDVIDYEKPDSLFFKLKSKRAQFMRYPALAQNRIGMIASFGEKIKNAVNWSQPLMTGTLFVGFATLTLVLMMFSAPYVMAFLGLVIFSEQLRVPRRTNALANFIDRIADDVELTCRDGPPLVADNQQARWVPQPQVPEDVPTEDPLASVAEADVLAAMAAAAEVTDGEESPAMPRQRAMTQTGSGKPGSKNLPLEGGLSSSAGEGSKKKRWWKR